MNKDEMLILIDKYIKDDNYQTRSSIMEYEDLFIDIFKKIDYDRKRKLLILNSDKLIALLSNEEFLKYLNENENYKWDIYHIRNRLKRVDKEWSKILIKKAEELLEHSSIAQHFLFIKENWKNEYNRYLKNDYIQLPLLNSEYGNTVDFIELVETKTNIDIWKQMKKLPHIHISMVLDNIRTSHLNKYKKKNKFKQSVKKISKYSEEISRRENKGKSKEIPYIFDKYNPNVLEINDFWDMKINFEAIDEPLIRMAREINSDVYGDKICHSSYEMQIFIQELFQRCAMLRKQRKNLPIIKPKFMTRNIFEAYKMAIYGFRKGFVLPSLEFLILVIHSLSLKKKISLCDENNNLKISEKLAVKKIISSLQVDEVNKKWLRKISSIVMSNNRKALNARNNIAHYLNTTIDIAAVSIIYLGWWLLKFSNDENVK